MPLYIEFLVSVSKCTASNSTDYQNIALSFKKIQDIFSFIDLTSNTDYQRIYEVFVELNGKCKVSI